MKGSSMSDQPQRIDAGILTIWSERRADAYWIRLEGEMDHANTRDFENELTRIEGAGSDRIVLDLGRLEFIDSTGLAVVFRAHQRATKDDHRLGVLRPGGQVANVFEQRRPASG
jgi:anti-anti-sigma factor